jgi:APA family basic amino acid/polyamine antiporter
MPWLAMIAVAMVGSVFSSDAWNNITFAAAEVKDPQRTIPRALVGGVLLVTALYILTNLAYLSVLPLGGSETGATALERGIAYATNDRVGAAAADVMFGPIGAGIMAVLIMISTFGCNNGLILSGARAYYAMASDKLFFRSAATLNKNDVPSRSLWMQAAWASVLCLSGRYGDLLDYVVFAVLIFYVLTIIGIIKLRRTRPDLPRPIKAVGYPILPALYIVIALGICVSLLIYKPNYSWPGLIIVATGVPVYLFWSKRSADSANNL